MFKVLGVLVVIGSALGALAFWVYAFFIWGVFGVIHSLVGVGESLSEGAAIASSDEASLVWGIAWIFIATIVSVVMGAVGVLIGLGIYDIPSPSLRLRIPTMPRLPKRKKAVEPAAEMPQIRTEGILGADLVITFQDHPELKVRLEHPDSEEFGDWDSGGSSCVIANWPEGSTIRFTAQKYDDGWWYQIYNPNTHNGANFPLCCIHVTGLEKTLGIPSLFRRLLRLGIPKRKKTVLSEPAQEVVGPVAEMPLIKLKNGTEEPEAIVRTILVLLKGLKASGINGVLAFHDLVELCRNPDREATTSTEMTIDTLKKWGLVKDDGTVQSSIANIVMSSAEGEELGMSFVSPIAQGSTA